MKQVSVMLKPASSLCNLRCKYCFYADVAQNRTTPSFGMMKPETMAASACPAPSAALPRVPSPSAR